jgi:F0F1-type ATP synthase assembly protein I
LPGDRALAGAPVPPYIGGRERKMSLEKLALIAIVIVGAIVVAVYGTLLAFGVVATFPYGLPVLAIVGMFVFICVAVLIQRLRNREDDYYEKNVRE